MTIRLLCYELYKLDWLQRISVERQADALKDWYQETDPNDRLYYTITDYLNENGYSGELYVCFGEFLDTEYMDRDYIKGILDNDDLYQEYLNDIQCGLYYDRNGELFRTMPIFCSTTDLYDSPDAKDVCELDFPERIVRNYFDELVLPTSERDSSSSDALYDEWLDKCNAGDTYGLYEFAVKEGWHPKKD